MFTGLIEAVGAVRAVEPGAGVTRVTIAGPASLIHRLNPGDSVAVSGVCLTALDIDPERLTFAADLAAETVARTSLSSLRSGSAINLELPTPAGTPLGGHIVQGHVDGVATLDALEPVANSTRDAAPAPSSTDWWLRLTLPPDCVRYVVEKGSITVEGISLTVARIEGDSVTIAIIPHTYAATNLHTLSPGSPLNIEVDVLAKYAEKLGRQPRPAHESEFELTVEYLIANGY